MNHLTPNPTKPRILVIEDEPDISALLKIHLTEMPADVTCASDGQEGYRLVIEQGPWQAVVMDLRLPGMNGLEICRAVRNRGDRVPILMLTALGSELDRVLGLEIGADDYLTKPFSVMELMARLRALWRRVAETTSNTNAVSPTDSQELRLEALHIDRSKRRVWLRGLELTVTPREFDLLWHFARHPGRAFSRSELLADIWGYGHDGYDHTVNTHINRLRNKLGEGYIQTVWGVGYRFEAKL